VKRIRLAYRHLTESNEVYQPRAGHKCLCRYVAVTLRDLERHRQSGYTKYDGRAAVSYNRVIWCCYCGDHVPYTPRQFYGHMMKMHNVWHDSPRLWLTSVRFVATVVVGKVMWRRHYGIFSCVGHGSNQISIFTVQPISLIFHCFQRPASRGTARTIQAM